MEWQTIFTILLLIATLLVMSSQKLRADLVAMLVMLLLILSGIISAEEAFRAFGQPVIIVVAGIYVIGAALFETGVATIIANQMTRYGGKKEVPLLLVIMLTAALMTSVLGAMLVVALLMPAILRIARQTKTAPSRLLLPLAATATVGNQLTLIGTPSNLLVNDILAASGQAPLGLFSLTPYALASITIVIGWYLFPGRRLLSKKLPAETELPSLDEVEHSYKLENLLYRLRVRSESDLIGHQLELSNLSTKFGLNLIAVRSQDGKLRPAKPGWVLEQNDILIVAGEYGHILQAAGTHHLELKGPVHLNEFNRLEQETLRLAEVVVPFRSALGGKTLAKINFRGRYGLNILAVQRRGKAIRKNLPSLRLEAGDTMLVQGSIDRIRSVGKDLNLAFITDFSPRPGDLITSKAGLTIGILLLMLAVVVTGLVDLATATLAASLILILTQCIGLDRAYRSIDFKIIVLIGSMLPLAVALERTGAAQVFVDLILGVSQSVGVMGPLFILYLLATVTTQVISNSVVAALMMPIAINLAVSQGASPRLFAIAVAFAVNAAYITPLTNGNNLLVREPGQYKMRDFLVNGLPIFILQTIAIMSMLAFSV